MGPPHLQMALNYLARIFCSPTCSIGFDPNFLESSTMHDLRRRCSPCPSRTRTAQRSPAYRASTQRCASPTTCTARSRQTLHFRDAWQVSWAGHRVVSIDSNQYFLPLLTAAPGPRHPPLPSGEGPAGPVLRYIFRRTRAVGPWCCCGGA